MSISGRALVLGAVYWFKTFIIAFVIGLFRTLFVAPYIGAIYVVIIELPIMIYVSYNVAVRMDNLRLLSTFERLEVGVFAFMLLMISEAVLAVTLANQSLLSWIVSLGRVPGVIGVAGQVIFALVPVLIEDRRKEYKKKVDQYDC